MASRPVQLLCCVVAVGARVAMAEGDCDTHGQSSCHGVGGDHVLLQLADANWLSRASPAGSTNMEEEGGEQCRTTEPGEQCHAAATWAMKVGVKQHPEWYPNLTMRSSFAEFQAHLSRHDREGCPKPCDLCHTAVPGEACHAAVTWAREHGIRLHPEWYLGLTYGASFEEFQAHLHAGGMALNGRAHAGCPMPCNLCRTVSDASEPCYTDLEWAMGSGIRSHPEWYPGLKENSSPTEFQGYLNTLGICPRPCGECHTTVEGERCYQGVVWAMETGIKLHPQWYPELTADSTFQAFQMHLHQGMYEQCPEPCM